jgi:hypothetical protein
MAATEEANSIMFWGKSNLPMLHGIRFARGIAGNLFGTQVED